MEGVLEGYRILDLCDYRGFLCGKILADMGADVIKVEPPGGDNGRDIGPFYENTPHRESSLFWFAFNTGKRSITLNLETSDGRAILHELVSRSDVLLESYNPEYLGQFDIGYDDLKLINTKLVMTSITPFGQKGPYKDYKAPDVVVFAMGGLMYLCGDPDRAPVQISFPQSYIAASTYAAEATMIALYARGSTGLGQHIDVSAQSVVTRFCRETFPFWTELKQVVKRAGIAITRPGGVLAPMIWTCKDGYVSYLIQAGQAGAERNKIMADWLKEEELATEYWMEKDWDQFDWSDMSKEELLTYSKPLGQLFLRYTMNELYAKAVQRGISLFPVTTSKDLVENAQLGAREFWVPLYHDHLGTSITYPGPFLKMSETPITVKRRAPLIGEHNREIYEKELGLTQQELITLRGACVI